MELTTTTLLTAMPGFETPTVAPVRKLDPESVTGTTVPWKPEEGLTEVSMGGGGLTVKVAGAEVPLAFVTVTPEAPVVALAAMAKEAVI